ncbi:MAG: hypothetical protein ACRELV_08060 [Longimicrobiales bacterium]
MEPVFMVASLGLALAAPLLFVLYRRGRRLPVGSRCGNCSAESFELRVRVLGRLLRAHGLRRRWCPRCGWQGFARTPTVLQAARPALARPAPIEAPTVVVLRSIEVDGRLIDVAVHCRPERPRWVGRLAFAAGAWRWTDESDDFRGDSLGDILVQTLTLSDRAIMHRVRQALYG